VGRRKRRTRSNEGWRGGWKAKSKKGRGEEVGRARHLLVASIQAYAPISNSHWFKRIVLL